MTTTSSSAVSIEHWAAWAPSLESPDAWRAWLRAPQPLPADAAGSPPLAEMPAMMRRRIEPLGRVALQAAYWAQGDQPVDAIVFASRWGELARSLEMLHQLAAGEALSPTAFSLSVHNAVAALYSIARKDRCNVQAVSAGEGTLEAGFAECQGLIADGAARVLYVYTDAPLPEIYSGQVDTATPFPYAFACLLGPGGDIALRAGADVAGPGSAFDALRFLLDEAAPPPARPRWHWTRRHA